MYREKYVSAFKPTSLEVANRILDAIREEHPESSGWKEIFSSITPLPDGTYEIMREHQED